MHNTTGVGGGGGRHGDGDGDGDGADISTVTLMIKGCPNRLVQDVVLVIDEFGQNNHLLQGHLNITDDHGHRPPSLSEDNIFDKLIYVQMPDSAGTATCMQSFVEQTLNAEYGIDMYCVVVQPKRYAVLYALRLDHTETPSKDMLKDVFAPFGRCNIRTKDRYTTYINFHRFEHVQCVLRALNASQLIYNEKTIPSDMLYAVQNSKLMLSLDRILRDKHDDIVFNKCISKQNLWSWFIDMKKRDRYDKTWRQLVDFVSPRVLSLFGWTYDALCECFRAQMAVSHSEGGMSLCVQRPVVAEEGESSSCVAPVAQPVEGDAPVQREYEEEGEGGGLHFVENDAYDVNGMAYEGKEANDSDEGVQVSEGAPMSARVCAWQRSSAMEIGCEQDVVGPGLYGMQDGVDVAAPGSMPIFHKDGQWGLGMKIFTTASAEAMTYSNASDDTQQQPVARESCSFVVERMNYIPLYGAATHPLHRKLCTFEQTLFGQCEASNVDIHYRLVNMELMMNINGEHLPTPVRLSALGQWIEKYLECLQ